MINNQKNEISPYVIVDIEFNSNESWFILKNIGRTPAYKIEINIEPKLITNLEKSISELIFKKPISFLAPNKIINSYIDTSFNFLKDSKPREYKIQIQYCDKKSNQYNEKYMINLENHKNRAFVDKKEIDDIHKILKEINNTSKLKNN